MKEPTVPACLATLLGKCSSQTHVLFSLQQHKAVVRFWVFFTSEAKCWDVTSEQNAVRKQRGWVMNHYFTTR